MATLMTLLRGEFRSLVDIGKYYCNTDIIMSCNRELWNAKGVEWIFFIVYEIIYNQGEFIIHIYWDVSSLIHHIDPDN